MITLLTTILCLATFLHGGDSPPYPSLERLSWLEGHWIAQDGDMKQEEVWSSPSGDMILGFHRDTAPNKKTFFEFLRIQQGEDGIVYLAMPNGRGETGFQMTKMDDNQVIFENPNHDFPKFILYRLEPQGILFVQAKGEQQGKPVEYIWRYTANRKR